MHSLSQSLVQYLFRDAWLCVSVVEFAGEIVGEDAFVPPIINPCPEFGASLKRGFVDNSFINLSRAVPLLPKADVKAFRLCNS